MSQRAASVVPHADHGCNGGVDRKMRRSIPHDASFDALLAPHPIEVAGPTFSRLRPRSGLDQRRLTPGVV
jgi:hypothetical protein